MRFNQANDSIGFIFDQVKKYKTNKGYEVFTNSRFNGDRANVGFSIPCDEMPQEIVELFKLHNPKFNKDFAIVSSPEELKELLVVVEHELIHSEYGDDFQLWVSDYMSQITNISHFVIVENEVINVSFKDKYDDYFCEFNISSQLPMLYKVKYFIDMKYHFTDMLRVVYFDK